MILDRLTDWRRLLRQSVTQGRAVIQRIVKGRIVFTPALDGVAIGKDDGAKPNGYMFEAPTRFDKLFTGVAAPRPAWMGTRQPESPASPEQTFDADYGQLLERAERRLTYKRGSSPTGFEPVFWP